MCITVLGVNELVQTIQRLQNGSSPGLVDKGLNPEKVGGGVREGIQP